MNQGQFSDPLCYMCLCAPVISSLPLVQGLWVRDSLFTKKLSMNSLNSVKVIKEKLHWQHCTATVSLLPNKMMLECHITLCFVTLHLCILTVTISSIGSNNLQIFFKRAKKTTFLSLVGRFMNQ